MAVFAERGLLCPDLDAESSADQNAPKEFSRCFFGILFSAPNRLNGGL